MQQVTIAHLGAYPSREFAQAPGLWVRSERPVVIEQDGTILLPSNTTCDFTTFFGSLSIAKYIEYTDSKKYTLSLDVSGSCEITLTWASTFQFTPELFFETTAVIESDNEWQNVTIDVPDHSDAMPKPVIIGCIINTRDDVAIRNYQWKALIDGEPREVQLALCTTTFKKEKYVIRNVDSINRFLKLNPDMARHFTLHVVDNGQTLSSESVSGDCICLHQNSNVGGAGGFARGMIESMNQCPTATHVLLMDDDVSICPESLFRTYALLTIVSADWNDAFVGGAMMDYVDPSLRFEDIGFMNKYGTCARLKPLARVDSLHDVVENEAFLPPFDNPDCSDLSQRYQAWFYCCIPMHEIKRRGMPLPLFVRFDDVEYSLRGGDNQKIMTVNGICVWHLPFFMRMDQVTAFYQVPRNLLIARACSNMAPQSNFENLFYEMFEHAAFQFNYQACGLINEALRDFLKGPDYCFAQGFAENSFIGHHRAWRKYKPLSLAQDELQKLGVDVSNLLADKIVEDMPRSSVQRKVDNLTLNGQRYELPGYTINNKVAVIDAADGSFQPGVSRRASVIVAIDVPNGLCEVRKKDREAFMKEFNDFRQLMASIFSDKSRALFDEYHSHADEVHSVEWWKRYLSL